MPQDQLAQTVPERPRGPHSRSRSAREPPPSLGHGQRPPPTSSPLPPEPLRLPLCRLATTKRPRKATRMSKVSVPAAWRSPSIPRIHPTTRLEFAMVGDASVSKRADLTHSACRTQGAYPIACWSSPISRIHPSTRFEFAMLGDANSHPPFATPRRREPRLLRSDPLEPNSQQVRGRHETTTPGRAHLDSIEPGGELAIICPAPPELPPTGAAPPRSLRPRSSGPIDSSRMSPSRLGRLHPRPSRTSRTRSGSEARGRFRSRRCAAP